MAVQARWAGYGVNTGAISVTSDDGNDSFTFRWGDGTTSFFVTPENDQDPGPGPRVLQGHTWAQDGVYEVSVSDDPAQSSQTDARLRAYVSSNDPDGTVVNAAQTRDLVITGAGNDQVRGGAGDDLLFGAGGDDKLSGGVGNDVIIGGDGADALFGGAGVDYLVGDDGADKILGEDGLDFIDGGGGRDTLTGGAGGDSFIYEAIGDSVAGLYDVITDFEDGADAILLDLYDLAEAGVSLDWIGTAAFSGRAGELRYASRNGVTDVYLDSTGDGRTDFQIRLTGTFALTQEDFRGDFVDDPFVV